MRTAERSRGMHIFVTVLWTLLALLVAAVVIRAAVQKFMGVPAALEPFEEFGWPTWTIYLTGIGEIVGSIALIIPRTRPFGGMLLILIMIGAAFTNFANGHPDYVTLNAAIIAGSGLLIWQSRDQLHIPTREKHRARTG